MGNMDKLVLAVVLTAFISGVAVCLRNIGFLKISVLLAIVVPWSFIIFFFFYIYQTYKELNAKLARLRKEEL